MNEESVYEPLAEIFINLNGYSEQDIVYVLCSRVLVEQAACSEETAVEEEKNDVRQQLKSRPKPFSCDHITEENGVRFFNSSTESPPPVRTLRKRDHEEAVSCYCSASHYSTDEHDSLRESSALHHSDSGADLSESSRDLDWEKYWAANGERLIWESWITKYGDYINPSYIQNSNEPGQGEETSFCIQPSEDNGSVKKISFSGLLEDMNCLNEDLVSENTNNFNHFDDIQRSKTCVIYHDDSCDGELFHRRLSDISEGGKSGSGRSEISSNCEEEERFRLSGASRCSGNSMPLTSTTDSMTNVTRMTISSSDSSYGADDSSARSLSLLSSTDSASSTDQQWQQLWTEHFNEQYYTHYQAFIEKYNVRKHNIIEEGNRSSENYVNKHENVISAPAIHSRCSNGKGDDRLSAEEDVEEEDSSNNIVLNCHQDSSRSEMFVDIDSSVADSEPVPPDEYAVGRSLQQEASVAKKSGKRKKGSRKFLYVNKINSSVGHLLQSLHTMSVMSPDLIEEDETLINDVPKKLSKFNRETDNNDYDSIDVDDKDSSDNGSENLCNLNEIKMCDKNETELKNSCIDDNSITMNDAQHECKGYEEMEGSSYTTVQSEIEMSTVESPDVSVIHASGATKRSHDSDVDDASVDRAKSAFHLMGFVFRRDSNTKFPNISKAQVVYKKRNIRSQNRSLRINTLKTPMNRHIYFDDDDDENSSHTLLDKVKNFLKNESEQITSQNSIQDTEEASEENVNETINSGHILNSNSAVDILQSAERDLSNKPEIEEFSEKDDSTDEEVFYSAEDAHDGEVNQEKRETKGKSQPKRRKKKQLKKKMIVEANRWPQEIDSNQQLKKYWYKRYSLFSRFDEGIKMDEESWYSVTPERVSKHIAERCRSDVIIDAFCGAGGNAIQFAFTCEKVIAIDIDPIKVELAKNNARVYGVEDRIEFVVGDFLHLAPMLKADVIFLSPPWGGPDYNKQPYYNLSSIKPIDGAQLYKIAYEITPNIAFYLPRNINTHQLLQCAGPGGYVEIEQNFLGKTLIAVTAYFDELIQSSDT